MRTHTAVKSRCYSRDFRICSSFSARQSNVRATYRSFVNKKYSYNSAICICAAPPVETFLNWMNGTVLSLAILFLLMINLYCELAVYVLYRYYAYPYAYNSTILYMKRIAWDRARVYRSLFIHPSALISREPNSMLGMVERVTWACAVLPVTLQFFHRRLTSRVFGVMRTRSVQHREF